MAEIELKALIKKKKNKVVTVECNADLVDVLLSFLTMPMGTIIKLTKNQPFSEKIGSMNNLYSSVEFLDAKHFRTCQCKAMLLSPLNIMHQKLRGIELALGNDPDEYFVCQNSTCTENLLSYFKDAYCHCGTKMNRLWILDHPEMEDEDGGMFVKGLTRYVISDELQIAPLSTAATLSLLSKQGIKDGSCTEEKNFRIGKNEITTLLTSLLVSKSPLTEILLKKRNLKEAAPDLKKKKVKSSAGASDRNICVKLMISKTSGEVYYAEADEDFIDLLFSFLTIPLGFVAKEMQSDLSNECASNLYQSVRNLDPMVHLISMEDKQSLLFPTIHQHFGIEKQLLGVEETEFFFDETVKSTGTTTFTLLDPKSGNNSKETCSSAGGYVRGDQMFIVTNNLVITPISALSGLSILNDLNVSYGDIEERIVHVGEEEATQLLVASLISQTPLTDVFT